MSDAQPSPLAYDAYLTAQRSKANAGDEVAKEWLWNRWRETQRDWEEANPVLANEFKVDAEAFNAAQRSRWEKEEELQRELASQGSEKPQPRLRIWSDGRMVKLKVPAFKNASRGGKRGLAGCSRASRKRAIERLHTIPRTTALPQFYTLTFPDLFPDVVQAKVCLTRFFKRLKRRFPQVSAMWRLELMDRKSGKNKGQVAPHFHLLVFGGLPVEFADRAWFEACQSSQYAHLKYGTHDAGVLQSWQGAVFYAAKDMVKPCMVESPTGRIWGIHNRAAFPAVKQPSVSIVVTAKQVVKIERVMRKIDKVRNLRSAMALERRAAFPGEKRAGHLLRRARAARWRARDGSSSRTMFCERPAEWLRLLESLG